MPLKVNRRVRSFTTITVALAAFFGFAYFLAFPAEASIELPDRTHETPCSKKILTGEAGPHMSYHHVYGCVAGSGGC